MGDLVLALQRMGAKPAFAQSMFAIMAGSEINTRLRQAHFLGQLAVESAGFRRTIESLNYSVEGLARTFSRRRISLEDCRRYGRTQGRPANQEAIANIVYGGEWGKKHLGNIMPGDGWKFRGHGLIQTTGRYNTTQLSRGMFSDNRLAYDPSPIAQLPLCVESALFYWRRKNCNEAADRDDVVGVTKKINPALHAIDAREERTRFAKRFL